ncbi:hypothetical protein ACTPEF_26680, partial [Clostridioides difficile]
RFKMASNQLIYNYKDDELFDFIYENEYYDQAHFIKEFKKFSGKQETNIEARRRKAVLGNACKGLYAFSDTVCHIVNKIKFIGFL